MFPTKVLLAVDGSLDSDRAARAAVGLAEATGSELHVVHIGGPAPPSGGAHTWLSLNSGFGQWTRERLEHEARQRLEEQLTKIRAWGGEISGSYCELGRPDAEIVLVAEQIGAGLVVVGSRGLGRLKRALLGNVSLGVVRHVHCSVLVVRGDENEGLSAPILVAIDGSRTADEAAGVAAEISAATGADLHVVHALDLEAYMPYLGPEAWAISREEMERAARDARTWVEGQAQRLRDRDGVKKIVSHPAIGFPDREVVRLAEQIGAGLVIVGSRGLGGVRRMLLGSVSDPLVRHAHCSVMVVRAGKPDGG
jgi:nucleotide-binding universal stress UspA family protein